MAGIGKWGHQGPLVASEGPRASLVTRSTPVAALGKPHWLLKLNLKLCPILVWGTGDVLGPTRSLASTPPPWGCSWMQWQYRFSKKRNGGGRGAKGALYSTARINTWLVWPKCCRNVAGMAVFNVGKDRSHVSHEHLNTRRLSLLLFGKINPCWTASGNQSSTV